MKGIILTFILGFTLASVVGQHPIRAQFSAQQIGGKVRVDFGVIGGASCVGVTMERRANLEDFEEVGVISGICGGSEYTEYYFIEDSSPIPNTLNYYRLSLGQQGNSSELAFEFIPFTTNLFTFPNPAENEINLRWDNVSSEKRILRIYDMKGRIIDGDFIANSSRAVLDISTIETGSYFVVLMDEDEAIVGVQKFIKL
jgi:hypothetical protein